MCAFLNKFKIGPPHRHPNFIRQPRSGFSPSYVHVRFQRLTGPEPAPTPAVGDDEVTTLAGARLLSHYQDQWSRLHTNSERTVTAVDVSPECA